MCHLEDILRCRLAERDCQQAEATESDLDLRTALAQPPFASMFFLDTGIQEREWGMQVTWVKLIPSLLNAKPLCVGV